MKKKKMIKLAEARMKMLKSGKIKVSKNQKIDVAPLVGTSVDNVIISRVDGIISKEDVVSNGNNKTVFDTSLTDELKIVDLAVKTNDTTTKTIVVTVPKKKHDEIFHMLDEGPIGELLRTSTLGSIYTSIKDRWIELNKKDKTNFTNVLYIPDIVVFFDSESGKFKKHRYKVNLLILAVPSIENMSENGIEKVAPEIAIGNIITDILATSIKVNAKDIIINPFSLKMFKKNSSKTSEFWYNAITSKKCFDHIDSITFSIPDEGLFVTFNSVAK